MPFVPAFLLMAQAASTQAVEVPLLYTRPSRILKTLQSLPPMPVGIKANDDAGTLTLSGSSADIAEMKTRISLFDVEVKKVDLDLKVVSPLDHAEWKAGLTMMNNRPWSGTDDATGVELKLQPRLNDDGTVTVSLETRSAEFGHFSSVFRSKLNEEVVIGFMRDPANARSPLMVNSKDKNQPKGLRIMIKYVERPKA